MDEQRDPFAGDVGRGRMSELVWREPTPNTGHRCGVVQLGADSARRAWPPASRTAHNAEQPADRQFSPHFEPRVEVRPRPAIHSDPAALIALTVADKQRATDRVEVGLVERERLADPQPGTPQDDDDAA
jgi:hypothetical protein